MQRIMHFPFHLMVFHTYGWEGDITNVIKVKTKLRSRKQSSKGKGKGKVVFRPWVRCCENTQINTINLETRLPCNISRQKTLQISNI